MGYDSWKTCDAESEKASYYDSIRERFVNDQVESYRQKMASQSCQSLTDIMVGWYLEGMAHAQHFFDELGVTTAEIYSYAHYSEKFDVAEELDEIIEEYFY